LVFGTFSLSLPVIGERERAADDERAALDSVDVGSNSQLNSLLFDGLSHFAPFRGGERMRRMGTRSGYGRSGGAGFFGGAVAVSISIARETRVLSWCGIGSATRDGALFSMVVILILPQAQTSLLSEPTGLIAIRVRNFSHSVTDGWELFPANLLNK
jgi:hypothetical protein